MIAKGFRKYDSRLLFIRIEMQKEYGSVIQWLNLIRMKNQRYNLPLFLSTNTQMF